MTGESTAASLRPARESDYEAIAEALQHWWTLPGFDTEAAARERAALVPRLWLQHFAGTSFVAERDGRLVGFLLGFLSPDRRTEGYIHFIGVAPSARRVGVARALYERFFEICTVAGRERVRCVTTPGNTVSMHFHQSMGFEAEAGDLSIDGAQAKKDYDGPGLHRVAFVRALA